MFDEVCERDIKPASTKKLTKSSMRRTSVFKQYFSKFLTLCELDNFCKSWVTVVRMRADGKVQYSTRAGT